MRPCPKCKEQFDERLSECPFCLQAANKPAPWYFHGNSLFISFLVVGPFMLPLVWFHPKYSPTKKFVISFVIIGVTLLITALFGKALEGLWNYYKVIADTLQ